VGPPRFRRESGRSHFDGSGSLQVHFSPINGFPHYDYNPRTSIGTVRVRLCATGFQTWMG